MRKTIIFIAALALLLIMPCGCAAPDAPLGESGQPTEETTPALMENTQLPLEKKYEYSFTELLMPDFYSVETVEELTERAPYIVLATGVGGDIMTFAPPEPVRTPEDESKLTIVRKGDWYEMYDENGELVSSVQVEVYEREKAAGISKTQHTSNWLPPEGNTLTNVRVDQVYKGGMAAGDTLKINQVCVSVENENDPSEILVYSSGNLMPIREGRQYILFLEDSQVEGAYTIFGMDVGKFLVPKDRDPKIQSLSELQDNAMDWEYGDPEDAAHWRLAAEVYDKYL